MGVGGWDGGGERPDRSGSATPPSEAPRAGLFQKFNRRMPAAAGGEGGGRAPREESGGVWGGGAWVFLEIFDAQSFESD